MRPASIAVATLVGDQVVEGVAGVGQGSGGVRLAVIQQSQLSLRRARR